MDENIEKIDLIQYIDRFYRTVIHFRILLCLIVLFFSLASCIQAYFFFETTYSSKAVFVTTQDEVSDLYGVSENDEMLQTFTSLITGSEMQKIIKKELNVNAVPGIIAIQQVEDTNLIELIITSEKAQDAYDVAQCILDNYGQVTGQVMSDVSLVVFDQPMLAETPDQEINYLNSFIKGFGTGFIVSCIIALILTVIRRKVISSEDIKNILHLSTISKVPYINSTKKRVVEDGLLINNPRIQYSFRQSFHEIRMKLEQDKHKEGHKAFMLTSTMPDEGKSMVSTNIALSLAKKGYKVILVDLDLRNPSIIQNIHTKECKATIVDYLKGNYRLDDAISHYEPYELDITFGISSDEDATALLSSPRFEKMIAMLKERYDFVIMDAPPLYMMGDALLIAQKSDSAVVVIRQDYAGIYDIQDAIEELNEYVPHISGAVLNQVRHSLFLEEDHPYGYGDGYGYGYRYGYDRRRK